MGPPTSSTCQVEMDHNFDSLQLALAGRFDLFLQIGETVTVGVARLSLPFPPSLASIKRQNASEF
jgi:hypothetical protein